MTAEGERLLGRKTHQATRETGCLKFCWALCKSQSSTNGRVISWGPESGGMSSGLAATRKGNSSWLGNCWHEHRGVEGRLWVSSLAHSSPFLLHCGTAPSTLSTINSLMLPETIPGGVHQQCERGNPAYNNNAAPRHANIPFNTEIIKIFPFLSDFFLGNSSCFAILAACGRLDIMCS